MNHPSRWFPIIIAFLQPLLDLTLSAAEPETPRGIPPKTITLAGQNSTVSDVLSALHKQSGIPLELDGIDPKKPCPVSLENVPFWNAVEQIATALEARISLGQRGQKLTLSPRRGARKASSIDGPFRVVVREVQSRMNYESGKSFTEITLETHWEPRFPVFRIDSQPTIQTVADNQGSQLTALTVKAKTPPGGYSHVSTVRLEGVPRSSSTITKLEGSFTVTASERMLLFAFSDIEKKPALLPAQEGVQSTLLRFEKLNSQWEAEIALTYPAGQPQFESFESWVTENRARLIAPDKSKIVDSADEDIPEMGRRIRAVYRFPGTALSDRKGWTLMYETPAPLIEFNIRFQFSNIALP